MSRFCRITFLMAVLFAAGMAVFVPQPVEAGVAVPVKPILVDRNQGFVYFTIYNGWSRTITHLHGKVYGYGLKQYKSPALLNNPDQPAMKVSLGKHRPGAYALYRFAIPEGWTIFPRYTLAITDANIYHRREY